MFFSFFLKVPFLNEEEITNRNRPGQPSQGKSSSLGLKGNEILPISIPTVDGRNSAPPGMYKTL